MVCILYAEGSLRCKIFPFTFGIGKYYISVSLHLGHWEILHLRNSQEPQAKHFFFLKAMKYLYNCLNLDYLKTWYLNFFQEGEEIIKDFLSSVKKLPMNELSDAEFMSEIEKLKQNVVDKDNAYVKDILASVR